MGKRGQLTTIDFIGSVAIFIIILIGIIGYWNTADLRFNANREQEELASKAIKITDVFVESQGTPTNWNETNVEVIGLVSSDRKLDSTKLTSFKNMTYDEVRNTLKIKSYDFYFKIVDINGATIIVDGRTMETGAIPNIEKKAITKIRRIALWGSQKVTLEFSMWKSEI